MTLKYESEILFDLMKRDGDVTPSDVLPSEFRVEAATQKLMSFANIVEEE